MTDQNEHNFLRKQHFSFYIGDMIPGYVLHFVIFEGHVPCLTPGRGPVFRNTLNFNCFPTSEANPYAQLQIALKRQLSALVPLIRYME